MAKRQINLKVVVCDCSVEEMKGKQPHWLSHYPVPQYLGENCGYQAEEEQDDPLTVGHLTQNAE